MTENKEIEFASCQHMDVEPSGCNPELPLELSYSWKCKLGLPFSENCWEKNDCPDYKPATIESLGNMLMEDKEEDKLRYIDFGEDEYRCPCCGKKLMDMKVDPEFLDTLIDLFKNHSEDIPLLLVGFFRAIHSPETGIPVDALPMKGEQN